MRHCSRYCLFRLKKTHRLGQPEDNLGGSVRKKISQGTYWVNVKDWCVVLKTWLLGEEKSTPLFFTKATPGGMFP